jgi:hypothetical protein
VVSQHGHFARQKAIVRILQDGNSQGARNHKHTPTKDFLKAALDATVTTKEA